MYLAFVLKKQLLTCHFLDLDQDYCGNMILARANLQKEPESRY